MPANLEIRFIEDGSPGSGSTTPGPSPGPAAQPGGHGPQQQQERQRAERSYLDTLSTLTRMLGMGGLLDATKRLIQAFRDSRALLDSNRRVVVNNKTGGGSAAGDTFGPQVPKPGTMGPDGVYEGEFEVKPERGLSLPGAPRPAGPLSINVGPAASAASGLGPLAKLGAIAAVASAVVYSLKMLADALRAEAEALAGYSGEVAKSVADADVRMQQAEMRRAQLIGPDLAAANTKLSKLEESWYDFKTGCLYALLKIGQGIGLLAEAEEEDRDANGDPYSKNLAEMHNKVATIFHAKPPNQIGGPGGW